MVTFTYLSFNLGVGPSGWVAPSAPPIPLDGYSDLPPPTYEQAITVDEGDQICSNKLGLYSPIKYLVLMINTQIYNINYTRI